MASGQNGHWHFSSSSLNARLMHFILRQRMVHKKELLIQHPNHWISIHVPHCCTCILIRGKESIWHIHKQQMQWRHQREEESGSESKRRRHIFNN